LLFTVFVPGTVAVLAPWWIAERPALPAPWSWNASQAAGAALALVGLAVYFRCLWDFGARGRGTPAPIDPPRALVVTGLYRWVRNPMYWGVGLFIAGEAIFYGSRGVFLYLAVWLVFVHLMVVLYEENALRRAFGAAYEEYCRTVPRWLPRRPRSSSVATVLLLAASAIGFAQPADEEIAAPLHVLFIGNSLTYTNDLPGMLTALAAASGKARPFVRSVSVPGFSLEDHWNQGDAKKAIAVGGWDFVVLQQGPSASSEGVSVLRAYARWFAREIRAAGARPVLYMVWPSAGRRQDFDGVARSYGDAARDVNGLLCPAGEAWRLAAKRDPKLALYSPDGLHPTAAGTYLAALTFFDLLYGKSPVGLPLKLTLPSGEKVEIPEAQARVLQAAAAEAKGQAAR
jgi:protein-S-isoprenylcysteine O-methyltransferase Ste14